MHIILAVFVTVLFGALPAHAAEPVPPRFASAPLPIETFEIDGMLVERHGTQGRPLILIPGLGGGAWVWHDMVRRFTSQHVVYVVTLPGFSGRSAIPGDPVANARTALRNLIVQRAIQAPVLVGHSLGATLSLALAQAEPQQIAGVVAIDGLPVFPGTDQVPREQRTQMAAGIKASMAGLTRTHFDAQQKQYMRTIGSIDMARADDIARMSSISDPAAVTDYIAAAMALDLREGLALIKAPVLLIVPYYAPDGEYASVSQAQKLGYYRTLMTGTPNLKLVPVAPARHFVMLDQPDQVAQAITDFVRSL